MDSDTFDQYALFIYGAFEANVRARGGDKRDLSPDEFNAIASDALKAAIALWWNVQNAEAYKNFLLFKNMLARML